MVKSFLISILVLLVHKISDVHLVVVNFNVVLGSSTIDLDCNYTLGSYKLDRVEISKDRQTFLEFAAGRESCKFLILSIISG